MPLCCQGLCGGNTKGLVFDSQRENTVDISRHHLWVSRQMTSEEAQKFNTDELSPPDLDEQILIVLLIGSERRSG